MLTPNEKRIKIAELCGYDKIEELKDYLGKLTGELVAFNSNKPHLAHRVYLPDYLNDLNAMHEAEKSKELNLGKYWENLSEIVIPSAQDFGRELGFCRAIHATASQRADAFLLTHGIELEPPTLTTEEK